MIGRVSFLTLLGLAIGAIVGVLAVGFVEFVLWMNEALLLTASSRQAGADPNRGGRGYSRHAQ